MVFGVKQTVEGNSEVNIVRSAHARSVLGEIFIGEDGGDTV